LIAGRGCGWELFVYLLIYEKPLGPECVPRAETDNEQGK
jgi:hypothetical protein